MKSGFHTTGFYLHTHWSFNYPFAVRSWSRVDFNGMFNFLRALDFDRVMIWPISEALPSPLSPEDARYLDEQRAILQDAHAAGLECWFTFAPAISTREEIRARPVKERHFNRHALTFHLDHPGERETYYMHLADILTHLSGADGYVFIDGDPGGYPGARPAEFLDLLRQARQVLDRIGAGHSEQAYSGGYAQTAKIIAWLWSGWGANWSSLPPWTQDFRPLTEALLTELRANPPGEPWELLPGRSFIEGWANGRVNFRLVEEAGLLPRSTLMTYEIIEFEPVPPAVTLQFSAIRRVLMQELRLAEQTRGIFANAQQPIMPLPNLYFFSRGAKDPAYLDRPDEQVLRDFANLLGGPPELLMPAWRCLDLPAAELSLDLPQRLRDAALTGSAAAGIPGGPERYLHILASHLETWRAVQAACAAPAETDAKAAENLAQAILALENWHQIHGYTGAGGNDPTGAAFATSGAAAWEYCHPRLLQPLVAWVRANLAYTARLHDRLSNLLADSGRFTQNQAGALVGPLLRGEVNPVPPGSRPHNDYD